MVSIAPTTIQIECADGFALAGSLFAPEEIKGAVMIAPATGIRRQFYTSFAKHLASHRYAVLTFDNRGIGESIGSGINDVDATIANWGRLDMTAILAELERRYPDLPKHLVGHSAGGQLVGMMQNADQLQSMFNFGCSSGSLQYARYPFRFLSSFFLNVFIPVSNAIFGYTKTNWVGMGEPLPKRVASDWRRYCNGKGYIEADLGTTVTDHVYDTLQLKSLWLHASDDDIANSDTVRDMIRVYSQIDADVVTLSPETFGFDEIGHMSFFSSKKSVLWDFAVDWLDSF